MKPSLEFVKGKHGIGYVESNFFERMGDQEFGESKAVPKFQKLERSMTDAQILEELKPGLCTLADVLAFIKNPPDGTKDGCSNLFYIGPAFVVRVLWRDGRWRVDTWPRGGDGWSADCRVFSPAAGFSGTQISNPEALLPFVPCPNCGCKLKLEKY